MHRGWCPESATGAGASRKWSRALLTPQVGLRLQWGLCLPFSLLSSPPVLPHPTSCLNLASSCASFQEMGPAGFWPYSPPPGPLGHLAPWWRGGPNTSGPSRLPANPIQTPGLVTHGRALPLPSVLVTVLQALVFVLSNFSKHITGSTNMVIPFFKLQCLSAVENVRCVTTGQQQACLVSSTWPPPPS